MPIIMHPRALRKCENEGFRQLSILLQPAKTLCFIYSIRKRSICTESVFNFIRKLSYEKSSAFRGGLFGLLKNQIFMQTSHALQMTLRRLPHFSQVPTYLSPFSLGATGAGTKPMPLTTASHSILKAS